MSELNPGFDGRLLTKMPTDNDRGGYYVREGQKILHYRFIPGLTDLSPVRALPCDRLVLAIPDLYDLEPLRGLPIKQVEMSNSRVRRIDALAGMPLEHVSFGKCLVSDFGPLSGAPLQSANLDGSPCTDISFARGLPLTSLVISNTRVADVSPLAGSQLKVLHCEWNEVTDISPLKGLPLETLMINANGRHGLPAGRRKSDISVLEGMPLKNLRVDVRTYFEPDLVWLRQLPQKHSVVTVFTKADEYWEEFDKQRADERAFVESVAKLAAEDRVQAVIERMKRQRGLDRFGYKIEEGAVTEIAFDVSHYADNHDVLPPLRALPRLKRLFMRRTESRRHIDFSPLIDLPIEEIECGALVEYNVPVIRHMKSMKTLNGRPVAEVLAEFEK